MSSSEPSSSNLLLHTNNKLPVTYRCLGESVPPRGGNYLILALPPSAISSGQVISPDVSNVIWSTLVPPWDNRWKGKSKHLRENIHTFHYVWIKLLGTITEECQSITQISSLIFLEAQICKLWVLTNHVTQWAYVGWHVYMDLHTYIHTSPLLKCVSILAPLSTDWGHILNWLSLTTIKQYGI